MEKEQTNGSEHSSVRQRNITYTMRVATEIWDEEPSQRNPYLVEHCRCRGYELFDLMEKRGFVEVLHLLLLGELPSREHARILETLMIAFINPGPRHPATRAAIYAGCGRTHTAHILPIALSVLSGERSGGAEVTAAMRFINKNVQSSPSGITKALLKDWRPPREGEDRRIAPGFGSLFNGIDPFSRQIADRLKELPGCGPAFQWSHAFCELMAPHQMGWLNTGLCAAVFLDLGLPPRSGAGLFQLISAPGLLAHGLELANKPLNSVPFLDEEHYHIES